MAVNHLLRCPVLYSGAFMRALSAAIFKRDPADEAALKEFHKAGGRHTLTPEQLAEKGDRYYDLRCRRLVNAKAVLKETIPAVIRQFEGTEGYDADSNSHVVTPVTWQVWNTVEPLIDSDSFCGKQQ